MTKENIISFNTRIPKDLKDKIKLLAVTEDKSMQALVVELLLLGLEAYSNREK